MRKNRTPSRLVELLNQKLNSVSSQGQGQAFAGIIVLCQSALQFFSAKEKRRVLRLGK